MLLFARLENVPSVVCFLQIFVESGGLPEEFRCLRCWRRAARWFAPKMEKHQNTPTTSQSSPCKPHTLVWRASARLRWDNFGRACATASAGTAYVSSLRSIPGRLVAGPSSRLLEKIRKSTQGLALFGCMCAGVSTATHLPRPGGDRCQRQRASASHFGSTPLCRR